MQNDRNADLIFVLLAALAVLIWALDAVQIARLIAQ